GGPAGTVASTALFFAKYAPFIKMIGPVLTKILNSLDTTMNLYKVLAESCLNLNVVLTDNVKEATHFMTLACRKTQDKKCVERVIRFIPLPDKQDSKSL